MDSPALTKKREKKGGGCFKLAGDVAWARRGVGSEGKKISGDLRGARSLPLTFLSDT